MEGGKRLDWLIYCCLISSEQYLNNSHDENFITDNRLCRLKGSADMDIWIDVLISKSKMGDNG